MLLVVSRMYKSRFAEHAATAEFHPQLRRFTACSGLRIEVYLRHTRGTKNYNLRSRLLNVLLRVAERGARQHGYRNYFMSTFIVLPPRFTMFISFCGASIRRPSTS